MSVCNSSLVSTALKLVSESVLLSSSVEVVICKAVGIVAITIVNRKYFKINSLYKIKLPYYESKTHYLSQTFSWYSRITLVQFVFWCGILFYLLWNMV